MLFNAQDHIVIVGLGKTGLSCVEYLSTQVRKLTVIDPNPHAECIKNLHTNYPQVNLLTNQNTIPTCDAVILSPGVDPRLPAILALHQQKIPIYSDLDLFVAANNQPIIGITGSNGKSTVTTLVHLMLVANKNTVGLGGNIGIPALSLLKQHYSSFVFELSSFQLELVRKLPMSVGCILNIAPDHLDRHLNFTNYKQAKHKIYHKSTYIVYNRDDPHTFPKEHTQHTISFGTSTPKNIQEFGLDPTQQYIMHGDSIVFPINRLHIFGRHNTMNAMSALAIVYAYTNQISPQTIQALCDFTGLEHRAEKVAIINNVLWINDSKGTNIAATSAVLDSLATAITGKWIIILGGILKETDLEPLITAVHKHCKLALILGKAQKIFFDALHPILPCIKVNSLLDAIITAKTQAQAGDGVLLSPACASFDMFKDYKQRGEMFKQLVTELS